MLSKYKDDVISFIVLWSLIGLLLGAAYLRYSWIMDNVPGPEQISFGQYLSDLIKADE